MDNGYIALYRKILDWEWYTDANALRLFIHLLLTANWKRTKWQGNILDIGEVVVGRRTLARELFLSESQIRNAMEKLKKSGAITVNATNRYSIVKIVNYERYQHSVKNEPPTDRLQTAGENPQINKDNINIYNRCCSNDDELIKFYRECGGRLSPKAEEMILSLEKSYGMPLLKKAFEESARAGKPEIRYIEGILKNWKSDGISTPEEADIKAERFKKGISDKKSYAKKPKKNAFGDYNGEFTDFDVMIMKERIERSKREE